MAELKIIARYIDGRVIKGMTHDFWPNKLAFHISPVAGGPSTQIVLSQLKAIFVVKSFEGNANRAEDPALPPPGFVGKKLQVTFNDGETVSGSTMDYNRSAPGFFLFPFDPNSNNQRIFVINSAVRDVQSL